jgi:hypothetical protein
VFCPTCSFKNENDALKCVQCGSDIYLTPPGSMPQTQSEVRPIPNRVSQAAIWSMALGFLGLVCGGLTGIPALILGVIAKRNIWKYRGMLTGSRMATFGLLLGLINLLISTPHFPMARMRAKVSRARSDMRLVVMGLESYYSDYKAYPPSSFNPRENIFAKFVQQDPNLTQQPTFQPGVITKPHSYITHMPSDPFASAQGASYCYYSVSLKDGHSGWIVWSAGPDKQYDLTRENIAKAYDPMASHRSEFLIIKTYDPTNGVVSGGDLWRATQQVGW